MRGCQQCESLKVSQEWVPPNLQELIEASLAGQSAVSLGEKHGVAITTIISALRRLGIYVRGIAEATRTDWARRKFSEARRWVPPDAKKLVAEYLAGQSAASLGKKYGVGRHAISKLLRRLGIPLRSLSDAISIAKRGPDNDSKRQMDVHQHKLVAAEWGRPNWCWFCESRDPHRKYVWARINHSVPADHRSKDGLFGNVVRLCVSCHRRWDTERGVGNKAGRYQAA
jgi:hypothetical protein